MQLPASCLTNMTKPQLHTKTETRDNVRHICDASSTRSRSLFPNATREEVDLLRVVSRSFWLCELGRLDWLRSGLGVFVGCIVIILLCSPTGLGGKSASA